MNDSLPLIQLRAREDRRVRAGHQWIYSNEIDREATPFREIESGSLVQVADARGKPLGVGYINPHALLCVRILSRRAHQQIDGAWFERHLGSALRLRERLFDAPYYRWGFGEADHLPGLVIDRFDRVLSIQITTAGMEALRPLLRVALENVLPGGIDGIVWRNDVSLRELEQLSTEVTTEGQVPERVDVIEQGLRFAVDLAGGQKTGWFYDQRDNRERLARYVRDARVLDVYSYAGAWGLRALQQGAASALSVDSSAAALAVAEAAAAANQLPLQVQKGQALDVMGAMRSASERFDVVIVDPPALIKRKKDFEAGFAHYVRVNRAAMELMGEDGILVSCSCSHHLAEAQLLKVLAKAARGCGRQLQILELGAQSADHPVHPAMPETRYLKTVICRVTAS